MAPENQIAKRLRISAPGIGYAVERGEVISVIFRHEMFLLNKKLEESAKFHFVLINHTTVWYSHTS
jgi:hypothetical protein